MRATLSIPDDLLSEVQSISGESSKTGAIVAAMREFVRQSKVRELVSMKGKVFIDDVTDELEDMEIEESAYRYNHCLAHGVSF